MSVKARISRAARAPGSRVAALMERPAISGGIVGLRMWDLNVNVIIPVVTLNVGLFFRSTLGGVQTHRSVGSGDPKALSPIPMNLRLLGLAN